MKKKHNSSHLLPFKNHISYGIEETWIGPTYHQKKLFPPDSKTQKSQTMAELIRSQSLPLRQSRPKAYKKWLAALYQTTPALLEHIYDFSYPVRPQDERAVHIKRANKFFSAQQCSFCGLSLIREGLYESEPFVCEVEHNYATSVVYCRNCGWWLLKRSEEGDYVDEHLEILSTTYNEGIVFRFNIDDAEAPVYELRKQLARKEALVEDMTPRELEIIVGSVFRDFFDVEVFHIGGPGDGGIDLLLVAGEIKHIIQVKRRKKPSKSECVSVVRDLIGSMVLNNIQSGIIVTTASHFSRPAKQASQSVLLHKLGFKIDLYNRQKLSAILELADPTEAPWLVICEKEGYVPPYRSHSNRVGYI